MGYPTPIEWTDATWNPIGGCSIASPGCKPCYAMQLAGTRLKNHPLYAGTTSSESGRPVFNGTMTAAADGDGVWSWPVRWRGARFPVLARHDPLPTPEADLPYQSGWPSLIFVGDMADLFHERRPVSVIDRVIGQAVQIGERPDESRRHIHQLLTKRPQVMADYFEMLLAGERAIDGFIRLNRAPANLWLGTSAERQKEFDERWPHLRRLAQLGFTVFVSYEPALGPLRLPRDFLELGRRAQLIAGGVSGRWPWTPSPVWFRFVRDQCQDAGVAFFFKQWGEFAPDDRAPNVERANGTDVAWPDGTVGPGDAARNGGLGLSMFREGKTKSGRLLDGVEWNEFPTIVAGADRRAA